MKRPAPAKSPCGSCPYRKDVPSGVWHESEYTKLLSYDGELWEQSQAVFMCHQRDGCLCAGWLAAHGPENLLAVRLPGAVDPSVWDYESPVPLFKSGREAMRHGIKEIPRPGKRARQFIAGFTKKRVKSLDYEKWRDQTLDAILPDLKTMKPR
jgi:Family of unknown function (DUF6283)